MPPQNPSQPAAPRAPRGAGAALQQDTAPSSSGAAATCWDVAGGAPQPTVPLLWAQHGTREGRTHTHTHLLESCCRGSTCWMCSRAGHAASPGTARHRAEPQTPPAVSAPGQALAQALQVVFHWSLSPTRLGAVSSRGIPVALTCAGAGAAAPLSGSRRSRRNPSRQRTRARGNPGRAAPEKCWHLPRPQQCRRRGLTFTRPGPWCRGAPHTAGPAAHRMGRQHWAGLCPSSPSPQSQQCPVPPRHPSRSGAQGLRAGSEGSSRAGRGPGRALVALQRPEDAATPLWTPAAMWHPGGGHSPGARGPVTAASPAQDLVAGRRPGPACPRRKVGDLTGRAAARSGSSGGVRVLIAPEPCGEAGD